MRRVLYLNDDDVKPLVRMADILEYCEEAYKLYGQYQAGGLYASFSPMSSYPTNVPHTDVDYRSGVMDGIPAICSTLGWGFWDNMTKYGLPSISVVVSLNDVKTGLPLALMTGYYLGAARTGAAAEWLPSIWRERTRRRWGWLGRATSGSTCCGLIWSSSRKST